MNFFILFAGTNHSTMERFRTLWQPHVGTIYVCFLPVPLTYVCVSSR